MDKTKTLGEKKEINKQFKILSAIGIIFILMGHCDNGGIDFFFSWFPNYSFNVALFVFISGYFYKDKYEDNVLKYIWGRTKRLLIPALIWNLFFGIFVMITRQFEFNIGEPISWYNIFVMPFTDGDLFRFNLAAWFVYPLFFVSIFNVLLRKLLSFIKLNNDYLLFVVYIVIGFIGVSWAIDCRLTGMTSVYKQLMRCMFMLPCFGFGKLYKSKLEKHDNLNNVAYFAIVMGVQLIILLTHKDIQYYPSNMNGFNYGFILPYVTALTGIAFWLRISRILVPALGDSKVVMKIANNTYIIMITHMLGFFALNLCLYMFNKIIPILSNFDANAFHNNIFYHYTPAGYGQFLLLFVVAGIIVPLGIQGLLNNISKQIKENILVKIKNKKTKKV